MSTLREDLSEEGEAIRGTLSKLSGFNRLSKSQQDFICSTMKNSDKKHLEYWFCHAAVWFLEHGEVKLEKNEIIIEGFANATYMNKTQPNLRELDAFIEKSGFPCTVVISHRDNTKKYPYDLIHSFIALGRDQNGSIITWDKGGCWYPYRVLSLKEIHDD